jgi:SAM-dependent methyltransferase
VPELIEDDPRDVVARGYDRIGERYSVHASTHRKEERERYLQRLFDLIPDGASVLDLGCGNGIPSTVRLAERYLVTGLDVSGQQIERARRNIPGAEFICADMTSVELPDRAFDGVFAAYSIIHVPRNLHARLLSSIHGWLKPGGALVATMGTKDREVDYDRDWLGAPMFWSSFDTDENLRLVSSAGFRVASATEETVVEDELGWGAVTFLWIVARAG